jgi:hypothetical protein
MAQIASLLVPSAAIPQPDSSWLSNLGGTLGGIAQNIKADRSFNAFADRIGGAPASQPQQAGFLSRLVGGGQQQASAPMTAPVVPVSRGPAQGSTYAPFIDTVKQKITNPYGLAAVAATGRSESGWSGDKANATWSDPSQSGQAGTSGGILSWRAGRLANLQAYARAKGEQGNGSPSTQAEFFLSEDPTLIDRLNAAQSPEQAADIMAGAWAFAGHDDPTRGEAARRRALTQNYYAQEFRDAGGAPVAPQAAPQAVPTDQPAAAPAQRVAGNVVASNDPSIGIPLPGWAGPMRANDPGRALEAPPQVAAAPQTAAAPQAAPAPSPSPAPMQVAQQGSNIIAPGVTPIARGSVDPSLIQYMLRDRNLRETGLQLWAANVQGQKASEPWQFVNLPDGTLARANQQTGAVERLGNFAKPNQDAVTVGDNLVDRTTGRVIYEGKPKTPASYQEYQLAKENGFTGTYADWEKVKVPGTSVNVNTGEGDKFYEKLDQKNAENFATIGEQGITARANTGQVDRLESLLANTPQGAEGAIKQWLGDIGVNTDGLDNIQATRALIEKMVPEQRAPGSGTMSDGDIAMFRNSLPRVINQPGGNALIIQTLRAINDYQMKQGEIADQVSDRSITPSEGRKRLRELANPLSTYRDAVKDFKAAPKNSGISRPKTDADFNALPSGALYVDPDDNKTYRKP